MGANKIDTAELNVDYLIALTTIKGPLDEDTCDGYNHAGEGPWCTEDADAQLYYVDEDGERQMATVCFSCLVPGVRYLASKGQKIIVEVPA